MPINVYGDLDRPVPQLLLDVGQRLALLNQETGVRVSQIVESHLSDFRLFQQARKRR